MPELPPLCVLVTRPKENAITTAEALENLGYSPIIFPMTQIVPLNKSILQLEALLKEPSSITHVIVTSANAVNALKKLPLIPTHLPAYAVGDKTTKALEELGFNHIYNANKDSNELFELIKRHDLPASTHFLYPSAYDVTGNIDTKLAAYGHKVSRVIAYQAVAQTQLSDQLIESLREEKITAALFYSARSACVFTKLIKKHGLERTISQLYAYVFSEEIASELASLELASVNIATSPNEKALFECLSSRPLA